MKRLIFSSILTACCLAFGAENDNSVPLFNGRDLSGWVNANCAPETWSVRNGVIYCTGKPTGALRTGRQYENFILELEWRHLTSGGNSGVFIWGTPIAAPGVPFLRGIEVQVLDNGFNIPGKNEWYTTHGDVFPIHGATMKPLGRNNGRRSFPSEDRSKSSPEWNRYRIVCSNGVLRLSVNGKEVSGGEDCNYRKGYLGLESEGAPVEFRNIRIKELPTSHPAPELVAPLDQGWRPLFTGLDLRGWKTNPATAERWSVQAERMVLKEGEASPKATLWTEQEFGDAEFVVDYRLLKPARETEFAMPSVQIGGQNGKGTRVSLGALEPGKYHRCIITVKGQNVLVKVDEKEVQRILMPKGASSRGALGLDTPGPGAEFMNLYARE